MSNCTTLQTARIDRGLSQSEAADLFGLTQGTWSRIERGIQQPSASLLLRIASEFGISTESLLSMFVAAQSRRSAA